MFKHFKDLACPLTSLRPLTVLALSWWEHRPRGPSLRSVTMFPLRHPQHRRVHIFGRKQWGAAVLLRSPNTLVCIGSPGRPRRPRGHPRRDVGDFPGAQKLKNTFLCRALYLAISKTIYNPGLACAQPLGMTNNVSNWMFLDLEAVDPDVPCTVLFPPHSGARGKAPKGSSSVENLWFSVDKL